MHAENLSVFSLLSSWGVILATWVLFPAAFFRFRTLFDSDLRSQGPCQKWDDQSFLSKAIRVTIYIGAIVHKNFRRRSFGAYDMEARLSIFDRVLAWMLILLAYSGIPILLFAVGDAII